MTRLLLCFCVFLFSISAHAGLKIGVTVGNYDNYVAYLIKALQEHSKDIPGGVTLQVEDASNDVVRQLSQVESFISQGVDAIIVSPADTAATANITSKITLAGIPLVYMNTRPEVEKLPAGVVFVGADEREIGRVQMQYLAEQMGGKGNLAIILGRLAHVETRKRTGGVKDILAKYPEIKVVEEQSGDWQREAGMNLMNNWITAGEKIDAVAANNDEMGIGAAMALKHAARPETLVAGIDGTPDAMTALKKGLLMASVYRDPVLIANTSLDAAVSLVHHENVKSEIWVQTQLLTPKNVEQYSSK